MQCNYGRWGMSQSTAAVARTICSVYCRVRVKGFWFGEIVKRQARNWQQEFRWRVKVVQKNQDAETVWVRRAEQMHSISCLVYLLLLIWLCTFGLLFWKQSESFSCKLHFKYFGVWVWCNNICKTLRSNATARQMRFKRFLFRNTSNADSQLNIK